MIHAIKQDRILIIIAGILFFVTIFLGYLSGQLQARISNINNQKEAINLINTPGNIPYDIDNKQNQTREDTRNILSSFYDSWDKQPQTYMTISKNVGTSFFLVLTSPIPITALVGLFKASIIGFDLGVNWGLISGVGVHGYLFPLALPHLLFEVPAIILTTSLTLRAPTILMKRNNVAFKEKIKEIYNHSLKVFPLIIFLFIIAGLIEGLITPILVQRLISLS